MKNIALIGIGPHAKRIYLHYFKKKKVNFELVVDLESKKDSIRKYLDENGFENTKIFTLPDKYKDDEHLPEKISSHLLKVCKILGITHLIISTEPKAHYMYLEFALKNNINVLTDKPITVTKNMTSLQSIEKIRKQYYEILELAKNSKGICKVMCQRQYHRGYEMIIFSLDTIGVSNNFTEIYLEYLTMVFNNVATKLSKSYQENGNVMGIHYNKYDKPLLSMFEKLSYNEKLDVLAEVFIRLGNDTLFNHKYQMLELSIDGFETARNIIKQKI